MGCYPWSDRVVPLICQRPRVVYVHVPKTGGTQTAAILRARGAIKEGAEHGPIRVVSHDTRAASTCVATLRDPWSWYASWYEHALTLGDEGARRLSAWGRGATDWRSVMHGVTHPEPPPGCPRSPGVLWTQGGDWSRVTAPHGLYTWAVEYFTQERSGAWAVDRVIDTAQLIEGWSEVLGVDVARGRANERKPDALPDRYADAYDDEMISWVSKADKPMIDLFGWEPFAPLSAPVVNIRDLHE